MASKAKQLRYRLEWLAVACLGRLIPLLPRPLLLGTARMLGTAAYHLDRRGRATGLANVRAAMAAGLLPEGDPEPLVRESFRLFARSTCDLFWAQRLDERSYSRHVQFEFEDRAAFERAAKGGAIWVTPHYGCFEWISLMMGYRGHPFTFVAQDFKNPHLTELFRKRREHSGHRAISSHRAMIRLLKVLRAGGNAAFLTDLTVQPGSAAVPIECFGFETCVTGLHGFLQSRTGASLIPGFSIPCADGSYLMRICRPIELPPDSTPAEIAQRCWDVFEPHIRERPEPWLWMYKHWRYRPAGAAGERYPAYANRSKKFDRWLKESRGPS